jgi:hypothetical protein
VTVALTNLRYEALRNGVKPNGNKSLYPSDEIADPFLRSQKRLRAAFTYLFINQQGALTRHMWHFTVHDRRRYVPKAVAASINSDNDLPQLHHTVG